MIVTLNPIISLRKKIIARHNKKACILCGDKGRWTSEINGYKFSRYPDVDTSLPKIEDAINSPLAWFCKICLKDLPDRNWNAVEIYEKLRQIEDKL